VARRKVTLTEEERKLREEIGSQIVEKLKEQSFECESLYKATVKYGEEEGNRFRKKEIIPGWEFFLSYHYLGAAGQMIFGLMPEDDQEYEFVEMNAKELDQVFPLMGSKIAETFGVKGEKLPEVIENVIAKHVEDQLMAAAREREAAIAAYEDNPEFGMF